MQLGFELPHRDSVKRNLLVRIERVRTCAARAGNLRNREWIDELRQRIRL
jgi:hypothetical protein